MIVHGCSDGFIVEMNEWEFNSYLEWLMEWSNNANMDANRTSDDS